LCQATARSNRTEKSIALDGLATRSEAATRKLELALSRRGLLKLSLLGLLPPGRGIFGFDTTTAAAHSINQRIRFGLNYVSRKKWWYVWQEWDARSISDDFEAISSLGMDHVRIQCLWPVFQPGIDYVSPAGLDRLGELLEIADRAKLDVEVTVLDGWLSGYSFLPAWVAPLKGGQNIFANTDVIQAEEFLVKTIAERIGRQDRFLRFDVGNEINVLQDAGGNPPLSPPRIAGRAECSTGSPS
jgi:Cellulase (glycosyl hydrolase family 5)